MSKNELQTCSLQIVHMVQNKEKEKRRKGEKKKHVRAVLAFNITIIALHCIALHCRQRCYGNGTATWQLFSRPVRLAVCTYTTYELRSKFQQQLHYVKVPVECGCIDWGTPALLRLVYVCTTRRKEFDHFCVAIPACSVGRGAAVVGCRRIQVCASIGQSNNTVEMT